MTIHYIGLDIGGTKIAGGVFTPEGKISVENIVPTPKDYPAFLSACQSMLQSLASHSRNDCHIGIGVPALVAEGEILASTNLPYLKGKSLQKDLEQLLGHKIRLTNDANCMALAEAIDGAGAGYRSVLGLIIGTGVGAGFVYEGRVIDGANGLTGEIGHTPLPYRYDLDIPDVPCGCGQKDCIENFISGRGLARLYHRMAGQEADAVTIAGRARDRDEICLRVLDVYFDIVARAFVTVLHAFDPHVIVVSGGLYDLPGFYEEVPKKWGKYALVDTPRTKIVPARHGPMSGMRGAAWLWR